MGDSCEARIGVTGCCCCCCRCGWVKGFGDKGGGPAAPAAGRSARGLIGVSRDGERRTHGVTHSSKSASSGPLVERRVMATAAAVSSWAGGGAEAETHCGGARRWRPCGRGPWREEGLASGAEDAMQCGVGEGGLRRYGREKVWGRDAASSARYWSDFGPRPGCPLLGKVEIVETTHTIIPDSPPSIPLAHKIPVAAHASSSALRHHHWHLSPAPATDAHRALLSSPCLRPASRVARSGRSTPPPAASPPLPRLLLSRPTAMLPSSNPLKSPS